MHIHNIVFCFLFLFLFFTNTGFSFVSLAEGQVFTQTCFKLNSFQGYARKVPVKF